MKDRTVQYPNRYMLTPVGGTSDTYDLTAVPGTVTEPGTVLNKANLLTDETAAGLGLSGDPTVNQAFGAVAKKSTLRTATLTAAGWTGTGPYTQTVTVTDLPAGAKGVIGLADSATAAQREAARDAMLAKTAQAAGSVTITADGDKPTINIPIVITEVG